MFLGLLIGLALWGLLLVVTHSATVHTVEHKRLIANTDPRVLASARLHGMVRLIGVLAFLLGTCGAVGWIIEVL